MPVRNIKKAGGSMQLCECIPRGAALAWALGYLPLPNETCPCLIFLPVILFDENYFLDSSTDQRRWILAKDDASLSGLFESKPAWSRA